MRTRVTVEEPTLPHYGKLHAVTHVLIFQTAYKMTSPQFVAAGQVSTKQNNWMLLSIIDKFSLGGKGLAGCLAEFLLYKLAITVSKFVLG